MTDSSPMTVLLVDDSKTVRLMAARLLTNMGFEVIQAEGGYEALAVLRSDARVDCVITDVVMPQLSGISFIRIVRQFMDFPIVAVTVEQSEQMKRALMSAGANAVLAKPLDRAKLSDVLAPFALPLEKSQ